MSDDSSDVLCVIGSAPGLLPAIADEFGVTPHVAHVLDPGRAAIITGSRARVIASRVSADGATVVSVAMDCACAPPDGSPDGAMG
ncbi:MAG: hypothetical protein M3548_20670 [Actinomycetota bacterium]|nr:hypothetical protein [Actinomycetota bacterium]